MEQPFRLNPGSQLDVAWDWNDFLDGDSIASFSVNASEGLSLSSVTQNGGIVVAWVSPDPNAPIGTAYVASCQIVTANVPPRIDSRDVLFTVDHQ